MSRKSVPSDHLQTAQPSVSPDALSAFRDAREAIIREVVARSLAREEEVVHHGDEAERLIASGIEFTTRMLDAAMAVGEVSLLEDQLVWAMDRLPHEQVSPDHVLHRFQIYAEAVRELLPGEYAAQVNRFLEWMIVRQQELVQADEV